jgi:thioredoxin 1
MMKKTIYLFLIIFTAIAIYSCNKKTEQSAGNQTVNNDTKAKITFIELGSVSCIPCRQMQPVMRSIEAKYSGKVKVIFYDVWKDSKPAKQYGIRLIPTQIFLDENNNEFFRHEGFYSEEEIDKLLSSKGITYSN